MYRKIISCLAMAAAFSMAAQEVVFTGVLDEAEDTTDVTSITNIIETQEIITSRNTNVAHFNKVWGRNSYFNLSYNKHVSLDPQDVKLGYDGYNNGNVPKFEGDWGAAIMLGHNYRLHKKPIANVVAINIDYTYIDLNINHYKAGIGNEDLTKDVKLYNSAANKILQDNDGKNYECLYTPWALAKYEANYGMMVGPSITIAPFTYINVPGLHFLKFNVYYHIGYHVSMAWMQNDKNRDANTVTTYPGYDDKEAMSAYDNYQKMDQSLKMNWGHGLISCFGFNFSWKAIGFGYEVRKGNLKYLPLNTDVFGKGEDKFKATTSRIYLTIKH